MAVPGTFTTPAMLLAMALAATAEVPKVAIRFSTTSLPAWNMPFSSPLGMPTNRMRLIMSPRNSRWNTPSTRTALLLWFSMTIMMMAAAMREASVPMPAPAAPMPKP